MSSERTFIAIKPDGVARGLIGEVISRFERRGYTLVAMKLVQVSIEHAQKHYEDLKEKPFYKGLCEYVTSGPVVAMVWQGNNVVKGGRALVGATNPNDAAPGTIRGDFCLVVGRNVIHGSDSVENANKEIALWFNEKEICPWTSANEKWVYEK
ncbi:nucleoside diphosphate kinase [Coelomomyces lativittatus]|nr:nucleoside diphosphate kinase [Coelomomyces lativittatus]